MGTVAVYFANPGMWNAAAISRDEPLLSASERERAAEFHREHDRRLFIVAHVLLRRALSEYVAVAPAALEFKTSLHGRPELEPEYSAAPPVRFSLSHTGGLAVCAIAADQDIGIDVEPLDLRLNMDVAKRCLDAAELADVLACSGQERVERFCLFWTLKEAYAKARGLGLGLDIQKTGFEVDSHTVRLRSTADVEPYPMAWQFQTFRVERRYSAALAIRTPEPPRVVFHRALTPMGSCL